VQSVNGLSARSVRLVASIEDLTRHFDAPSEPVQSWVSREIVTERTQVSL
jgi:hypothetical protein